MGVGEIKICVLGGGSSYIPELVERSINLVKSSILNIEQIALMDIDGERVKLVGELCNRMVKHAKVSIDIITTTDSKEAIEDSDFVISQIRVGTLEDRIYDEKFPLKYGLIGQESTGVGGFSQALRSVPVLVDYAKQVEKYAPNAFFLNNTNPQHVTHEAINKYSGVKLVGICEQWRWFEEAVANFLNVDVNKIKLVV
ncbi:MAG: family 4 glycosyl hydrolase, partial [Candidatus Baldrarchaeia archaeon]